MRMRLAGAVVALPLACLLLGSASLRAETVMQQCGQQYQAAKAGGTLNGMTWNQFRSDCAARLKAQPVSTTAPAPAAPTTTTANPLNPAPAASTASAPAAPVSAPAAPASGAAATSASPAATTGATAPSAGRAAFIAREKQCGAEWRANKTALVAKTPGLTWPKYLSQCNARLKSAGK